MQTILGVGTVGTELAKALTKYTDKIRIVGRNPQKVNPNDEIFSSNLIDLDQTMKAVQGSEVVYLTIGITYNTKAWQTQWSLVMQNVIAACKKHNAKLVFFDNVYMYGKVDGFMTEGSAIKPVSKKGLVRMEIAQMLIDEVKKGDLTGLIARSADFYGPNTKTSFLTPMVFENLKKGKKAQWMINDTVKHSLTYLPDAASAMALLGNTQTAYNQVWHLPTDKNALTGKEIIDLAAKSLNVAPKHDVLPRLMLRIVGLFIPIVKENMEMLYQFDSPYLFDSSKFEKAFDFKVTSYQEGIVQTAKSIN